MKNSQVRATADQVKLWWATFKKNGDEDSRNRLLEHYLPIVKYTAERLHTKLPDEVDVDDLISSGVFGLLDAVKSLRRKSRREVRNVLRTTYPRRESWTNCDRLTGWPRLVRSRASKVNEATGALEAQLGRKPNEKELAAPYEAFAQGIPENSA